MTSTSPIRGLTLIPHSGQCAAALGVTSSQNGITELRGNYVSSSSDGSSLAHRGSADAAPCHPARQPPNGDLHEFGRLRTLPRPSRRAFEASRRHVLRILPDAQSRSSVADAHARRRKRSRRGAVAVRGRGASALHAFFNARARTTGHLFQARFGCAAMDEAHWLTAVRYLAFNPVRAALCRRPEDWAWNSVGAHLRGRDDALVSVASVLAAAPRFADLLADASHDNLLATFETLARNGRPLGGPDFLARIEGLLGRSLAPGRPGRKQRDRVRESRNRYHVPIIPII
jgi:hypothetical protein